MDFTAEHWKEWGRLMQQVQEGDTEAYARLLAEMSPLVFHYVRRRVFNPGQVEDIYQDVLLTFHRARHTYQPQRPFSPWLFAVLRNAIWKALGKRRKFLEKEIPLEDLPEEPAFTPTGEGLDDRLHQALDSLPPDQRRAVQMLKLEGKDVGSAAKELGISKVALKVRAHRGYVQLRKILAEKN